jgi:cytochrome c peroxidase
MKESVLNIYNNGMPQPKPKGYQLNDLNFSKTDVHIQAELNHS